MNYIDEIAKINKKLQSPKALVKTYGCQMNARDSEKLSGMLRDMGYGQAEDEHDADLIIFNTCCVHENAENRLYGNLGNCKELKKQNPNLKLVLCGCMMQQESVLTKIRQSFPYTDVIFGTHNLYRFPELLHSNFETGSMIVDIWKEAKEIVEDLPSQREYPFKAGVNIMYGCDNYCTYCIVPYVRGRERSREMTDILTEIKGLVADGVVEVMLLGQNVNSYAYGFAELLHKVSEIDGLKRIRFTSNHPKDITDDVIAAIRDLPKVCKHLHLPFQAGSSRILELMNRKHTKQWYLDLVAKIRREVPGISLTTDIMVGFPGETADDFACTIDVVRQARFSAAFTFIYSRRLGTPADKMECGASSEEINARFQNLVSEVNAILLEINQAKVGEVLDVLVEAVGKNGALNGRADDNSLTHFAGDPSLIGKIVKVKILDAKTFYIEGEIV